MIATVMFFWHVSLMVGEWYLQLEGYQFFFWSYNFLFWPWKVTCTLQLDGRMQYASF